MRLYEILTEVGGKSAVFSFGRMNPPTMGHEKLIMAGKKLADSKNADFIVFPSKTQDKKKNPLDINTKVKFLRGFFPDVTFITDATIERPEEGPGPVRTPFEALRWLEQQGYKNVYMIVGSDRVGTFKKSMGAYVTSINPSVDPEKAYQFDHFDVISAGDRDPDADGAEGASGTKAREFVINGQREEFVNLVAPSSGNQQLKVSLYNELRKVLVGEQ